MPIEKEQWKSVLGYEGLYEVSTHGRVMALFQAGNFHKPGRILKPWVLKNGYLQVHLKPPGGKRKAYCIHRLVLEAFSGPAPEKCEARHLNCNREDNTVENLAWGTHSTNYQDSILMGTLARGERQWASKLTEADVLTIRRLRKNGMSCSLIAALYEIDKSNVSYIALRKSWRHI